MMGGVEYRESDVRYIKAIATHPDPVVTAPEIAEAIDVSQQAAYDRLSNLESRGLVKSKQVGARARIWWLTTTGREVYAEIIS